jgi:probable rRNA maturation factor
MLHHIENKTKTRIPKIPFGKIAESVLKQGYELSLVFVGNKLSQELNRTYRHKDNPTNILSFPLSETDGEIFIDIELCKKEATEKGEKLGPYLAYLFIHGLHHLIGFDHGSRMDKEEEKLRSKFKEVFKSSNL